MRSRAKLLGEEVVEVGTAGRTDIDFALVSRYLSLFLEAARHTLGF